MAALMHFSLPNSLQKYGLNTTMSYSNNSVVVVVVVLAGKSRVTFRLNSNNFTSMSKICFIIEIRFITMLIIMVSNCNELFRQNEARMIRFFIEWH